MEEKNLAREVNILLSIFQPDTIPTTTKASPPKLAKDSVVEGYCSQTHRYNTLVYCFPCTYSVQSKSKSQSFFSKKKERPVRRFCMYIVAPFSMAQLSTPLYQYSSGAVLHTHYSKCVPLVSRDIFPIIFLLVLKGRIDHFTRKGEADQFTTVWVWVPQLVEKKEGRR